MTKATAGNADLDVTTINNNGTSTAMAVRSQIITMFLTMPVRSISIPGHLSMPAHFITIPDLY
ncbi:MAG: hypothetical protein IPN60_15840 [Saprospiraceae bacterium]|nr:hypothetical protein [Candidatus Opimibacter skivensis]